MYEFSSGCVCLCICVGSVAACRDSNVNELHEKQIVLWCKPTDIERWSQTSSRSLGLNSKTCYWAACHKHEHLLCAHRDILLPQSTVSAYMSLILSQLLVVYSQTLKDCLSGLIWIGRVIAWHTTVFCLVYIPTSFWSIDCQYYYDLSTGPVLGSDIYAGRFCLCVCTHTLTLQCM